MDFNKDYGILPTIELGDYSYVKPISDIPHILIEGNPEKRNRYVKMLINQLISGFPPSELLVSFIDNSGSHLLETEDDSHLFCANKTNDELIAKLAEELERRYSLILDSGCSNVIKFNSNMKEKGNEIIPTLVVIFNLDDDFCKDSDLFYCIMNLMQKGRGAGIHVMISATNLKKNKQSTLIKINAPLHITINEDSENKAIVNFQGEVNAVTF